MLICLEISQKSEEALSGDFLQEITSLNVTAAGKQRIRSGKSWLYGQTEMLEEDSMLILTDEPEICTKAKDQGICCIGLEREEGSGLSDAYAVLTPPFMPDLKWLEMQLCHFHRRPFVLFEDSSFRIRESTWEDYPLILEMLRLDAQKPEPFGLFEELDTEGFLAYTERSYRMWGYGMWTVEKPIEPDAGRTGETGTGERVKTAGRKPSEPARDFQILGWCGLYTSSLPDGGTEMGYIIHPGMRRQGYGFRICREILCFAGEHLGIAQIYLRTNPDNHASIALAGKAGFSLRNTPKSGINTVLMCYNGCEL